jgi:hypothetical protein
MFESQVWPFWNGKSSCIQPFIDAYIVLCAQLPIRTGSSRDAPQRFASVSLPASTRVERASG